MFSSKKFKSIALLIIIFILLALGGYISYNSFFKTSPANTLEEKINYSEPTQDEKNAGNSQKDINQQKESSQKNEPQDQNEHTIKQVEVVITDAAQYGDVIEVRSFIPDHYEDGVCTISLSKNNHSITRETAAYKDVSTTICTNPLILRSDFNETGTWQLSVSYKSNQASGVSANRTIAIE